MYLLDYNRTMNEVFNGDLKIVDKDGILLGLSESEVSYEANAKGTVRLFCSGSGSVDLQPEEE